MKKGIREGEREVGGDGVCGCSFGAPQMSIKFSPKCIHNMCFSEINTVS
jgi:hypothetical protein